MIKHCAKLLILICLIASSCSKDDDQDTFQEKIYVIDNNAFGIKSNKTEGKVTADGINKAIQKAKAEGYNTVKLTKGDYLIYCVNEGDFYATEGIFVPTGITLDLGEARLHAEPNNDPHYVVIQIDHAENAGVRNGYIIGDRAQHKDKSHNAGYGIQVIASWNVKIENVKIESVTGSGVICTMYNYLIFGGKLPSRNVKISGCDISDCGSHGIHAVENVNLEISNNKISNVVGGPIEQFGIDINPHGTWKSQMKNVKVYNNTIQNCKTGGIRLYGGSNIEVSGNYLANLGIRGIRCQGVKILKNTIGDIYTFPSTSDSVNEDYCIPLDGDNKNDCDPAKIKDNSAKTANFTCL